MSAVVLNPNQGRAVLLVNLGSLVCLGKLVPKATRDWTGLVVKMGLQGSWVRQGLLVSQDRQDRLEKTVNMRKLVGLVVMAFLALQELMASLARKGQTATQG